MANLWYTLKTNTKLMAVTAFITWAVLKAALVITLAEGFAYSLVK